MGDHFLDNADFIYSVNCEQCRRLIDVELHIIGRDDDSYVCQEGMCAKCGNSVFIPLPESSILVDDALWRAITN